jgi:hypothetical protein
MPNKTGVGSCNVAGLDGEDDDLLLLMTKYDLSFLFVCETWERAGRLPPANDAILYWGPSMVRNSKGHFPCGEALMVRTKVDRKAVKVVEGTRSLVELLENLLRRNIPAAR